MMIPELALPRLHMTLRDTRVELARTRELAQRLARALDAQVDAEYGRTPVDRVGRANLLYEARQAGILND